MLPLIKMTTCKKTLLTDKDTHLDFLLEQNNATSYIVHRAVKGSFNQTQSDLFSGNSIGKQCTANAIVALCSLPSKSTYHKDDLDCVLLQGDYLYNYVINKVTTS